MGEIKKIDVNGETIYAEKISDIIYRCEESAIFSEEPVYGAEVEVMNSENGLKFVRMVKASPFHTRRYIWSKEFMETDKCKQILDKIMTAGGFWEIAMGGVVFLHIPIEKESLLDELLNSLKD